MEEEQAQAPQVAQEVILKYLEQELLSLVMGVVEEVPMEIMMVKQEDVVEEEDMEQVVLLLHNQVLLLVVMVLQVVLVLQELGMVVEVGEQELQV